MARSSGHRELGDQPVVLVQDFEQAVTLVDDDMISNGLGGIDTIIFDFKLTDATFTWIGNELIVETATSRTVLTFWVWLDGFAVRTGRFRNASCPLA